MTYRPAPTDRRASILAVISLVASVCFFLFSGAASQAVVLYQLSGLVLALIGIQIYLKFVQCDYVYEVTDNDLKIHKIVGTKTTCICSMALEESLTGVLGMSYLEKHKALLPKYAISLNYCKNIFSESYAYYFFNFNGRVARLKFEPNDAFAAHINKKINDAKKRAATGDTDDE